MVLRLLSKTVIHAYESTALYHELYKGLDPERVISPSDLERLPFVDKHLIKEAGARAVASGLNCVAIQNTSGTSGELLFLQRSQEEFSFIQAFYQELIRRIAPTGPRAILLLLDVPGHGTPTPVPTTNFVLQSSIVSKFGAARTEQILKNRYDMEGIEPHVSSLAGSLSQIIILTNYLESENSLLPGLEIKRISVTSDYMSPAIRRRLARYWRCDNIVDRYSLSEMFGGASSCTQCGGFHFDPILVPELVTLGSLKVTRSGSGRLALTSLYPFVQMQPLIRYLTDDVFELRPSPCVASSYFYLGRVGHCLIDTFGSQDVLISGSALYDTLDEYPFVVRQPASELAGQGRTSTGKPFVRGSQSFKDGRRLVVLAVAVHPDALFSAHEKRKHEEGVRTTLLRRSPHMRALVSGGEASLAVEFVTMDDQALKTFDRQAVIWTSA
ncbi:hypothetical protein [Mesorhizobium sp.]|uniref:hypothetical protein n=1 Tax=Mesorhizobium sp. TaxID=1871066 RepID=UPI00121ADB8B|nr:hypothetical protein [Mesorhizobium sp.]TIL31696.1 MAG: hypothetical protein E5Y82_29890 [Mesorhizobium sp.]